MRVIFFLNVKLFEHWLPHFLKFNLTIFFSLVLVNVLICYFS